jgi:hypothetical protein
MIAGVGGYQASGCREENPGDRPRDGQQAVVGPVVAHQLQADGQAAGGEAGRDRDGGVAGHGDPGLASGSAGSCPRRPRCSRPAGAH